MEAFDEVNVYRTPGTLTFLVQGLNSGEGGSSTLLSTIQPEEFRLVAISLMLDMLESVDSTSLIQKAQTLREGILVANADILLPVTAAEPTAVPQCGEDEVLVFQQDNGTMIAVCEPAPWLNNDPVPTPTAAIDQPTPTAVPVVQLDNFPDVDVAILGNCTADVHDWFAAVGPDGNAYRTWHPILVKIDPTNPDSPECTFAHEHGDPPLEQAPLPYFGYAAYHAGEFEVIREHQGYKVFTHKKGQKTGWDTDELTAVNPDLDMQFWVHQGSASFSRLSMRYHDVGFWSLDAGGRLTEVYYVADTGILSDKCAGQTTGGATRSVASECDFANEIWDFGGRIANAWISPVKVAVVNPMNFMRGNPNFLTSLELISTSDEICGVNLFPCDFKLPFGSPNSIWLGNMRVVHNANWQWSNAGGASTICTDPHGVKVEDGLCNGGTDGYILQRVASVNFFGGNSGSWDRTVEAIGDAQRLPLGAGGGN
jgi:hypothetical protein